MSSCEPPTERAKCEGGEEQGSSKEPRPTPNGSQDRATRDQVAKARERRQAALRSGRGARLSHKNEWIFVLLALAVALAWIFGRDSCTKTITKSYGTMTSAGDAQAPDDGLASSPDASVGKDEGW